MLRRLLDRSTLVALSECQADDLERLIGRRPHVLPNAVEDPLLPPVTHGDDDQLRIVFVGQPTAAKGFPELLDALPHDATLTVVGTSSIAAWRDHPASSRVTAMGVRDDVPVLIASHDVLALPSRVEAMPLVVLEAFSVGRPVVSSDVGALPEMVSPDVGITVPAGDVSALARALNQISDPVLRGSMGAKARERWKSSYDAADYGAKVRALASSDLVG